MLGKNDFYLSKGCLMNNSYQFCGLVSQKYLLIILFPPYAPNAPIDSWKDFC